MGRYRLDPQTGELDHDAAVEALARRLRKAIGDWTKNDAFNGNPLAILHDALVLTLGARTIDHLFPRHKHQAQETDEKQQHRRVDNGTGLGRE
jgi:hypothetical protein